MAGSRNSCYWDGATTVQRCGPCGSWLASDSGTAVIQANRIDAIAGKPAPTGSEPEAQVICCRESRSWPCVPDL
ncbi:hypothetical protein EJA70_26560 [Pseudomonas sp. PB103]|nr:hypothetical protein EJA70_26560 [Pseudomonas sp. PB103]